ncbi:MAG: preprotein translocase subunit SecG [Lachnospiraceae bacterium]|nr:preprotein translocase subunit SecG [Lachnospiraceae bacterium]
MEALRIVLTVIFILGCIALVAIVLLQEGKSQNLGAISGIADTYWGKNKGRSLEGRLIVITRCLAIGFLVLAAILDMSIF